MRLGIETVELSNFKSFRGTHRLEFARRGPGVHFMRGRNVVQKRLGSNGAGKSTIWDAISWCLFGITPDGLRNPDVRPWKGKGATAVCVDLMVDGELCEVVRTISPNRLTWNAKIVDQAFIDKHVMPRDLFNHTVLMGQGRPLFFDLDPKDKMELFSEVLGLDRWEVRSKLASDRAKYFMSEHDRMVGYKGSLERQLENAQKLYDEARVMADEWEGKREERVRALEKEGKGLDDALVLAQAELDRMDLAYDGAATELRAIEKDIAAARKKADAQFRAAAEAEQKTKAVRDKIAEFERELHGLGKGSNCPTCGQSLRGTKLAEHIVTINKKIEELQPQTEIPAKVTKALRDADAKLFNLLQSKVRFQKVADEARDMLDAQIPHLERMRSRLAIVKAEIRSLMEQENPASLQSQSLRKELRTIKRDIAHTDGHLATLERRISRARYWIKGFRDVRLYAVEEVLSELQLISNAMLEEVGLDGWSIEYAIERETKSGKVRQGLTVFIRSPLNDKPVRWEVWSGGETQRLRLVGALALSETLLMRAGIQTEIEILDEPTQHLSPEGVRDVVDLLIDRARVTGRQIFYTDHAAVESSRFASVITVRKDTKGSYLDAGQY